MTHKVSVKEHARELVQAGYSNGYAAAVVSVSGETIARWDRENGWRPKKPVPLSPVTEKRLRILVTRGWGCQTVSCQLGIYPAKLRRLVKERGLEFGSKARAYALSASLKKSKWEVWKDGIDALSERELRGM